LLDGTTLLKTARGVASRFSLPFSTFDDCVQEACLHVLEKHDYISGIFKPEAKGVRSYIRRAMRNKLIELSKSERRIVNREGGKLPGFGHDEESTVTVENTILHAEVTPRQELVGIFHNIEDERRIRALCDYGNGVQAARALGVPESSFSKWYRGFVEEQRAQLAA